MEKGAAEGKRVRRRAYARRRVQLSSTCAGAAACAMLAAPLAAGGGVQLPSCASAAKGRQRGATITEQRIAAAEREIESLRASHAVATRQFAVSAASFGLAGGARWTPPSGTGREEQSDESSASDEEWDPESWDDRLLGEGEARATMAAGDGVVRGRVRRHWIPQARPGLAADDTRRKCLAEKGWARRSVIVHGVAPSGASNMEELPGREEFGVGNAGALQWMEAALDFAQENFNDAGAEERTLDQRDCKVGLFGDFCERVGHGKLLHWVPKEEYGGKGEKGRRSAEKGGAEGKRHCRKGCIKG